MKNVKLLALTLILMLSFGDAFTQLQWVPFEGELPAGVVIGGVEKHRSLAVCRGDFQGALHPGKVVEKGCNIGYGGREKILTEFEVLTNKGIVELAWEKSNGTLPKNAIQAGTENGLKLYIGRAFHENGTHPGKIFRVGRKYICNIGYGGKEITYNTFEVLVEHKTAKTSHYANQDTSACHTDNYVSLGSYIGTMSKERQVNEGFSLVSNNLKYQTRVTDDGRLVIEEVLDYIFCNDGRIVILKANEIWAHTNEKRDAAKDYFLKFQNDGNLCIYSEQDGFVWCSMSNGRNGHHLELTNIGHIEVVNDHGGEVWPD